MRARTVVESRLKPALYNASNSDEFSRRFHPDACSFEWFAVCPLQADHAQAVIFWIVAWVTNDNDMVACLQRLTGYTLPTQLTAATPFDCPSDDLPLLILRLRVNKRMWIAEHDLDEVACDSLLLVFEIRCCKRMVRVQLNARK